CVPCALRVAGESHRHDHITDARVRRSLMVRSSMEIQEDSSLAARTWKARADEMLSWVWARLRG
ncbi:MAG: hypothetical protein ACREMQ_04740, partial [Longimicrobiales bacterium]